MASINRNKFNIKQVSDETLLAFVRALGRSQLEDFAADYLDYEDGELTAYGPAAEKLFEEGLICPTVSEAEKELADVCVSCLGSSEDGRIYGGDAKAIRAAVEAVREARAREEVK